MPITPPTLYQGIKYIRIHQKDLNNTKLGDSIMFADDVTVGHSNGTYVYTVKSIIQDPNNPLAYYLEVEANKSTSPANTTNALVIYQPELVQDITYSEYNAILNNASSVQLSTTHYQVDRSSVNATPDNIDAILGGYAAKAELGNALYTMSGLANARYNGSRLGANFNNNPTLETKIPFFATFDSMRQTSDIGGVYQFNVPYVVNGSGETLPTTDTKTLYYDMPSIFTQDKFASTAVRFSEQSPVNEQRQQRKLTDRFEIFKGGTDVRTLAVSTSGSVNSLGDTLTIRSGSFFNDIFFGEDTGVGQYTVDATLSGSEDGGSRTRISKNTDYIVEYNETYDPQNLFTTNVYQLGAGEQAECDLNFNATVLLAFDRDGTGWKKDIKTTVKLERSTDGGSNWSTVSQVVIPRFWNRYDINASQIPENVTLVGYRKIDGITGVYLAVNVLSGFTSFGGSNVNQMRTVVTYETSGNDDCFAHSKFEFLDGNGVRFISGLGAGTLGIGGGAVAGAAGQAVAIGGLSSLSATGTALALLSAPVVIGAAVGALGIVAALNYRSSLGQIRYKDTGINQKYVRIIFNEALTNITPVLYSEFKVSQEIEPAATINIAASAPFSRSLGGPDSTDITPNNIHYGSSGNPWLSLSPGLLQARGKVQSSTEHLPLGFKDFTEPLNFQPGDQIKFEGNENKVHTILEVVPRQAGLPDTVRGHYFTMLKVHPPVPGSTWVKNFQVRRFVQDPTKVLLLNNEEGLAVNKLQFTSSSLKGTIVPEPLTNALEEDFADIKGSLISKGIIS